MLTSHQKVLIISGRPLKLLGGTTSDINYEIEQLKRLGYSPVLMCPVSVDTGDKRTYLGVKLIQPNGRKYTFLPGPLYRLASAIHRALVVGRLCRVQCISFIHAHDVYSAMAAVIAGNGYRTILHLHSISARDRFVMGNPLSELTFWLKIVQYALYLFTCLVEVYIYNRVRLILCVSEFSYHDALKKGFNNRRAIQLLRNGIDIGLYRPRPVDRLKIRQELKIAPNEKVCLFLGRMVPKNGATIIARAVPLVNQKITNLRFVFVGEGKEKEKLEKFFRNHGISNVSCPGALPAFKALPAADIFISHVSSLVPGHGQTILEAMSSAVPTISGRDYIKEKIFQKNEILLIEKDSPAAIVQAIIALVNEEGKRAELARCGRQRVLQDFSIEKQYRDFQEYVAAAFNFGTD